MFRVTGREGLGLVNVINSFLMHVLFEFCQNSLTFFLVKYEVKIQGLRLEQTLHTLAIILSDLLPQS